ncbi:heme oxygenase [Podila verticillata]|nr:heme oxygenase [Podila verticillata]
MASPSVTETPLLTDELRGKTQGLHNKMDRIVQLGLFTVLDHKIYRQILLSFYYIFKTFEEEYERHLAQENPDPWLKHTYTPEMKRTAAFEKDLEYFYGPDWKEQTAPNNQTLEYMSHIRDISKRYPERLVAFPSTLYLGIFFGGMITRSKIVRSTKFFPSPPQKQLGGEHDNGIAIFTFRNKDEKSDHYGQKEDPNKIKNLLKGRLNSIPGIDTEKETQRRDQIGQEAIEIFTRNIDIMSSARGMSKVWMRWILYALLYSAIAVALFQIVFRRSDETERLDL